MTSTIDRIVAARNIERLAFLREALREARKLRAWQDAYLEDHTPGYCIHGVNHYVEWDCACGACEDGELTEYTNAYEYGLKMVRSKRDQRAKLMRNAREVSDLLVLSLNDSAADVAAVLSALTLIRKVTDEAIKELR